MTLAVLNVSYSLGTVGNAVGGAEQVLSAIDAALVQAGATSIVVACEGSRVRGALYATPAPRAMFDDRTHAAACAAHARAIAQALDARPVDVVHLHGVDFDEYLPPAGVPALATLHLPPAWYAAGALAPSRAATFVHCVSESQRRTCPPSAALLPTIPNGVEIPAIEVVRAAQRSAGQRAQCGVVALGRVCPEKGFHLALDAARRAGVPMTLAGRVFPFAEHLEYWTREIMPRLDETRRFVGRVDARRRTELLANARCILVSSLVPETSSLVAMEALAVGTPVVAFGKGALPEIVEHGVTGFLVSSEAEMADAINAAGALDRDACRAAAVERFSVDVMTRRYLERYAELVRGDVTRVGAAAPACEAHRPTLSLVAPAGAVRAVRAVRAHAPLDITVARTVDAFEALVPEWRALVTVADCTPFQSPEWLIPWWRHFGMGAPSMLVARREGELVGLAPLYVRREASGARVLAFIGTGNSDYVDLIARAPARDDVAAAVVAHALDTRAEWDRCELGPLPRGSALLGASAPAEWRTRVEQADVCPVLTLPGDGRGVFDCISAHFRGKLRHAARQLAREHDVQIEAADAASARASLDALCALHGARWEARGTPGVLADDRVRAFHDGVVTAMAEQGLLRLYVMRIDGCVAAAVYGFADASRLYYYISGFDPVFAQYSVGSLIILHAIDAAVERGVREVDFLRGSEAYKYRWGAVDRPVRAWRLVAASAKAASAA